MSPFDILKRLHTVDDTVLGFQSGQYTARYCSACPTSHPCLTVSAGLTVTQYDQLLLLPQISARPL